MDYAKKEAQAEGRAEGRAEGERSALRRTAKGMKQKGLSVQDISDITGLTKEEIDLL